jgi:hypothetical protein
MPSSMLSLLSDSVASSESIFQSGSLDTDLTRGPDGRVWTRIDHAPNQHRNAKVSRIWEFGTEYCLLNDPTVKGWRCSLCSNGVWSDCQTE